MCVFAGPVCVNPLLAHCRATSTSLSLESVVGNVFRRDVWFRYQRTLHTLFRSVKSRIVIVLWVIVYHRILMSVKLYLKITLFS